MLHIRSLSLSKFATHEDTTLTLPEKGLVAITGGNGAGKSSLLECVSVALWGESLRGEPGWRDGQAGSVSVTTDRVTATRKRAKASTKLEWQDNQGSPVTYETTTKAQAALEALIGSYDVWRRTCVLSSLDSAAFSLARDSDRKRLLEEFLGLGMFDTALDACRTDRTIATQAAKDAETVRTSVNQQLSFARSQLATAQADLAKMLAETGGKDMESLKSEGTRLAALHKAVSLDAKAAAEKVQHMERVGLEDDAKAKSEEVRLAKLGKDACPTCGQDVADAVQHLQQAITEAKDKARKSRESVADALQAARWDAEDLAQEAKDLAGKLEAVRADFRVAESQAKQREHLADRVAKAKESVAKWESEEQKLQGDLTPLIEKAAHLTAVERVLGLRGVRAQVLDHSLHALEQQANAWLARMPTEAGPLTITLAGSTTQKTGNVVDAIALRVQGRPYASCSGGERRRVDVALLLALRELAVAAHGRDGTLFCDEVFDALDQQGQADVAEALREMAEDRLVVCITHSQDLLSALDPDLHVSVSLENGCAKAVLA